MRDRAGWGLLYRFLRPDCYINDDHDLHRNDWRDHNHNHVGHDQHDDERRVSVPDHDHDRDNQPDSGSDDDRNQHDARADYDRNQHHNVDDDYTDSMYLSATHSLRDGRRGVRLHRLRPRDLGPAGLHDQHIGDHHFGHDHVRPLRSTVPDHDGHHDDGHDHEHRHDLR